MINFFNKIKQKLQINKIRKEQKKLFKSNQLHKSKNLIVFLLPPEVYISGGILSIFNIAKTSRLFKKDHNSEVILATFPFRTTYLKIDLFKNAETIYNFDQVANIAPQLDNLIIHIPEYLSKSFYRKLSKSAFKKLKMAKNLQINILNQNIEEMPDKEQFANLFKITNNITQTTAHHRYSTQDFFERYQIPLHLIPACVDISAYGATSYAEKENLIAYSCDNNQDKDRVLEMLKEKLPDYQTVEIKNMTFDQYMDTITKAKYTITFGEGFDAYLGQPQFVGSVGVAVYNETFFPSREILSLSNVFNSYNDLIEQFPNFVRKHEQNIQEYNMTIDKFLEYSNILYNEEDYQTRIKNFYLGKYDFTTSKE